jgi:hypothetical protein
MFRPTQSIRSKQVCVENPSAAEGKKKAAAELPRRLGQC